MPKFEADSDKFYFSSCKYSNDLDLLSTVIEIYSITVLGKYLVGDLEKIAIRFYLKGGYNEITMKAIMLECGMKGDKGKRHLDQINFKLTKKGFLKRHPTNHRQKQVNEELIRLKNRFLTPDNKFKANYYLIKFEK